MLKKITYNEVKSNKVLMTTYGIWCKLCNKYNCQNVYHPDPA